MPFDDENSNQKYVVLANDEEQYSIWPIEKAIPPGWRAQGSEGTKAECLGYVEEVWTDMRPLSLRVAMDAGRERIGGSETG